jgi:hypothetical protein
MDRGLAKAQARQATNSLSKNSFFWLENFRRQNRQMLTASDLKEAAISRAPGLAGTPVLRHSARRRPARPAPVPRQGRRGAPRGPDPRWAWPVRCERPPRSPGASRLRWRLLSASAVGRTSRADGVRRRRACRVLPRAASRAPRGLQTRRGRPPRRTAGSRSRPAPAWHRASASPRPWPRLCP